MQRSTLAILAATAVAICLVLGLSAFFVARVIASAPADLVERGGEALANLAAAFADHTVEIRFASEARADRPRHAIFPAIRAGNEPPY